MQLVTYKGRNWPLFNWDDLEYRMRGCMTPNEFRRKIRREALAIGWEERWPTDATTAEVFNWAISAGLMNIRDPKDKTLPGPISWVDEMASYEELDDERWSGRHNEEDAIASAALLTDHFLEALEFTYDLHALQRRKGPEPVIPYLGHLLGVCSLVIDDGGTEAEAVAALLHDAVEDAGGQSTLDEIRRHFGASVANIIADCSDTTAGPKGPWRERKESFIARVRDQFLSNSALRVIAADKLQNARSLLDDYRRYGDDLWERFTTSSSADQLWYYGAIADVLLSRIPGPLSYELDRTVTVLKWLVSSGGVESVRQHWRLNWTQQGDGWWATGIDGTQWEVAKTLDGRYAVTVGRSDKPDWYTDTLTDAQQLCFEMDRRPPFWRELMTEEWRATD